MPVIPPGVQTRDLSSFAGRLGAAWDALMGRSFGPGIPVQPSTNATEQEDGARQFQYPVAVNAVAWQPRKEYGVKLTPFEQLRMLARSYDVARLCVATRIEELQGAKWDVIARDKRQQAALQGACDQVRDFWQSPDKLNEFSSWLGMVLTDLFEIDALTIYKHPDMGGNLYALEIVDGATIKPLIDERGRTMAYQQILYGMPFSQYRRPSYGDSDGEDQLPIYAPHELIYRPRWTSADSPYGSPPTEWIIMRVNMALRKQTKDLNHFTDGNIPAGLISPPDGLMQPDQVRQFEEWFNADLAGEDRARARMKFLPWKADVHEFAPFHYGTEIDEWMLKVTCAAYGVNPSELGFTDDVNKASAGHQENLTYRRGIGPLTAWLKGLFDRIIQQDLQQPELEWQWNFGESADTLLQAQEDQIYFNAGVVSSQELRTMRYPDLEGAAPGPPAQPTPATGGSGAAGAPFPVSTKAHKGRGAY